MKKFVATISAFALVGLGSSSAHAALTTAPADDRPIYVLDQYNGNISRYNFDTQDTTLVCESDFPSTSQIVASEYLPVSGVLYWVRNDDTDAATLVSVNPITCEQSEAPLNWNGKGDFAHTDAIGLTQDDTGLVMYLVDVDSNGDYFLASFAEQDGEWVGTSITDDGNESAIRDIAVDPVTDQIYVVYPWCQVIAYPQWTTVADYAGLIYSDCTSLEIDTNQRWWITSQSTGYLNSDSLIAPGSSLEVHGTDSIDGSVYGEEFFFGPTDDEIAAYQNAAGSSGGGEDLASTGSPVNLGVVFSTAGLFFGAAIAFAVRARRLRNS